MIASPCLGLEESDCPKFVEGFFINHEYAARLMNLDDERALQINRWYNLRLVTRLYAGTADISFKNGSGAVAITVPSDLRMLAKLRFAHAQIARLIIVNPHCQVIEYSCLAEWSCPLEPICLPGTVEVIGLKCFSSAKINTVNFERDSALRTIGESTFANSSLKRLILFNSVDTIGQSCFISCKQLVEVEFDANSKQQCVQQNVLQGSTFQRIVGPN